MGTTIRPELSKKNPYWIEETQILRAETFLLTNIQYGDKRITH